MGEEGLKLSMATVIPVLTGIQLASACMASSVVGAGLVVMWENKKIWKPTHENWTNFVVSSVVGCYLSLIAISYLYKKTSSGGDNSVIVITLCLLLGMNGSMLMERAIAGFKKYADTKTVIGSVLKMFGLSLAPDQIKQEDRQPKNSREKGAK